jgi:outer membrane autotransporter protein
MGRSRIGSTSGFAVGLALATLCVSAWAETIIDTAVPGPVNGTGGNDAITVTDTGSVTSTDNNNGINGNGGTDTITNNGSVTNTSGTATTADTGNGVLFAYGTLANSGTIAGSGGASSNIRRGNGILIVPPAETPDAIVTNSASGMISGIAGDSGNSSGNGILCYSGAAVTNAGTISGSAGNSCSNAAGNGLWGITTLYNSGTVTGAAGNACISSGNGVEGSAFGRAMYIENSGTISGSCGTGGVQSGNGIFVYASAITIINSGLISGSASTGSDYRSGHGIYHQPDLGLTLTNTATGRIVGANMGIFCERSGADTITTAGLIQGGSGTAISLGGGSDTVNIQGGQIIGDIVANLAAPDVINFNLDGGTFTYNDDMLNFGTANLNSGLTIINGSLHAGTVNLNAGGTLGGAGTIYGSVAGPGAISPGNSIGTLNVVGDVGPFGKLEIEISDAGVDLLNVDGPADLTGAALQVDPFGLVTAGGSAKIVQTAEGGEAIGSLTGEFASVSCSSLFLSVEDTYDATSAYLTWDRLAFDDLRVALNHNQRALAANLEESLTDPGMAGLLTLLQSLGSASEYREALDQLSPELYDVWAKAVFSGAQLHGAGLERRLHEMRYGLPGFDFAYLFEDLDGPASHLAANDKAGRTDVSPAGDELVNTDRRLGVWGMAGVWRAEQDTRRNSLGIEQVGYDSLTVGGTVGLDYRVDANFIVGLASGIAFTDIDVDRCDSQADARSISVGPYMTYFRDRWYVDASALVGFHDFEMRRRIRLTGLDELAKSDTDGLSVAANVTGGYMFKSGNWAFGPTGAVRYTWLDIDGCREKNADLSGLRLLDREADSLRTEIGFRAAYAMKLGWGRLVPEVRVRWAHEFLDGHRDDIRASFLNSLAGPFTVRSGSAQRESAFLGAGVTAHVKRNIAAYINYDVDVGRKDLLIHGGNVGVRFRF